MSSWTALSLRATPGLDDAVVRHLLTLVRPGEVRKVHARRKEDGFDALNQADRLVHATRADLGAVADRERGLS